MTDTDGTGIHLDLHEKLATEQRAGVVWTLEQGGDLNVNLVRFPAGRGAGEHVNEEIDVLVVGVSGSGVVAVDGYEHHLRAGTVAFVPKGARRSTRSESEDSPTSPSTVGEGRCRSAVWRNWTNLSLPFLAGVLKTL